MTEPSTAFWSAAFDSGNGSFALGLPSSKNSSSADLAPLSVGFAKYASFSLSSSYVNLEIQIPKNRKGYPTVRPERSIVVVVAMT